MSLILPATVGDRMVDAQGTNHKQYPETSTEVNGYPD